MSFKPNSWDLVHDIVGGLKNMKEIKGKYGNAKVFTDLVEPKAIEQITILLDQEFSKDSKIRIMPDVHAGAGCTIGTTMTLEDKVCPNLVGVDIGCGIHLQRYAKKTQIDFDDLDKVIRDKIPSGFNIRDEEHIFTKYVPFENLKCVKNVNIDRAKLSLGTLGGGNHFIEMDKDDEGNLYLMVHSGSRHFGYEIAEYYQNLAVDQLCGRDKEAVKKLIIELKEQRRHKEISTELKRLKENTIEIPKELAYVSGQLFKDYLHDMEIATTYAYFNRLAIIETIWRSMGLRVEEAILSVHNYIDLTDMTLRKGAISAREGQKCVIPINMRDGALICTGKGNNDWNKSAPHGAGRLMSRAEARLRYSVNEFSESMDGIYTTSVSEETLDECPMAYKPIESIIDNIGDTVRIDKIIKPVYNFKAGK